MIKELVLISNLLLLVLNLFSTGTRSAIRRLTKGTFQFREMICSIFIVESSYTIALYSSLVSWLQRSFYANSVKDNPTHVGFRFHSLRQTVSVICLQLGRIGYASVVGLSILLYCSIQL